MSKKFSTDQRFIRERNRTYKIGTLKEWRILLKIIEIGYFKIAPFGRLSVSFWTIFCKIGHSVLAQLARIDDDDEYERSPVNNNSQFELARSHTDYDLELEFSIKNFETGKYGNVIWICNSLLFITNILI